MQDPDRPEVHFTARSGWINDPLGVTRHGDRYHLFYQAVPDSIAWRLDCGWGHAVSDDLLAWEELPLAIAAGDGDDGAWSGNVAVDGDGRATAFFTAARGPDLAAGRIRTATPVDDDWIRWRKGDVLLERPEGVAMFRDPFVFRDGQGWRMLVGASLGIGEGDTGAMVGYASPDLATWTPTGIAASRPPETGDGVWTGMGWECPQLIEVDGRTVLIVSTWEPPGPRSLVATVGSWSGDRFEAASWHRLTHDERYYAGSVFRDAQGRPCLMMWIRDARDPGHRWAGALSVPHLLVVEEGRVVPRPHPLLSESPRITAVEARTDDDLLLEGPSLVSSPDGDGVLVLRELGRSDLRIERSGGVLTASTPDGACESMPHAARGMSVLTDGPVVEIWGSSGVLAVLRQRPAAG